MKTILVALSVLFVVIGVSCGKKNIENKRLNPRCIFNARYGECSIYNETSRRMICQFDSEAITAHGFPIITKNRVYLYQGMYAWSYAVAFNPTFDPIISMNAIADCKEE